MNNIKIFFLWILDSPVLKRVGNHFAEFFYIWLLLALILLVVKMPEWGITMTMIGVILSFLTALVLIRPMNAVYGLMGTSGSIRLFFFNFVVITLLFAKIYQWGFFCDAGISYDVNQPHIDYNYYSDNKPKDIIVSDTTIYKKKIDSMWVSEVVVQETKLNYQSIGFWYIWRNTILTTLMQEPTEFFSAASAYNESIVDPSLTKEQQKAEILLDKQKAKMLQWILIFQVLISWIFFGVFISLLYNKFRYES